MLSHGAGGLGAVRSLARQGIDVTVIAYDRADVVLQSRYPSRKFLLHGETDDEKERHALKILRDLPGSDAAILTNSDRMVAVMARERQELSVKYRFALPDREIVDALNDKLQETKLIESLGFNVPKTVHRLPEDPEDLRGQLRYPVIIKPHSYLIAKFFPHKNHILKTDWELTEFYDEWPQAIPYLLAQEVIPGPDSFSWICSCTFGPSHELLDCGVKQKIRAFPAHFGGSSFAISAQNNAVVELTRELGKKLEYVGHAGVEFRWDARDEKYYYIEVNPRLPANVGFDEACGLPTVWNSYQVSLGNVVRASGSCQKDGLYFVDLKGDFQSLLADGVPIWRIAMMYLKLPFMPTSGLYFAWDDPLPAFVVGMRFVGAAIRRVLRKTRRIVPIGEVQAR